MRSNHGGKALGPRRQVKKDFQGRGNSELHQMLQRSHIGRGLRNGHQI